MSWRWLMIGGLLVALRTIAQQGSAPGEPKVQGIPADEYVDVTGDGIADLLITSRTIHISDPQQPGYLGMYKVGVRALSGTAILLWSTPSNQRWYTLEDSTRLDTSLLAARIHYKQVSWTDGDHPTEFWLLERPFGPAITKEQDGWYGTGDHHDGLTLVLRSANHLGTSVAAFSFELPYPYGRVVIKTKHVVRVPNGFGDEGDPVPREPIKDDPWSFGHKASEPQVIIPPGIPPDERVNLNGDEVDDLVITGHVDHAKSATEADQFVRGLTPLAGTAFLMTREKWGVFGFFCLREGEVLTPEHLANGLSAGTLIWASPERLSVFLPVMRHATGLPDEPPGWLFDTDAPEGAQVYRTMEYGRPIIGCFEIVSDGTSGQFGVRAQNWVEEGQELQVH